MQEYWTGLPCPPLWGLPNPRIKPRSPTLQVDSLPTEPQGKPSYTGMGSLSLLQGVFPTQELNQGLLHYSWILYQLSYQGSPIYTYIHVYIYISVCVCVCVCVYLHILRRSWSYPLLKGSSRPRNRTGASCIAGSFFTNWAIREALYIYIHIYLLILRRSWS